MREEIIGIHKHLFYIKYIGLNKLCHKFLDLITGESKNYCVMDLVRAKFVSAHRNIVMQTSMWHRIEPKGTRR